MIRSLAPVCLLLLAACSGASEDATAEPAALVKLGTAQSGSVSEAITIYGAVEIGGEAQYTLSAPAEAVVVRIAAPAGTQVGRGQLVAELRPSPATRAEIAKARNDLKTAELALARAQRLRADGLASDAEVENARQLAESARAMSQSFASQSSGLALRSPGPGYVQTVAVGPGDLVPAGGQVAVVSRGGDLRARFGVDPAAARRLSPGMTLHVTMADGQPPFDAAILSVNPASDPQTRLASVYIRVPAARGLGPGQPLTADAPLRQAGGALTIPYRALLDDGGQPFVFVVVKGVAHRRDLVAGPTDGDRIAVLKGLSAGEAVVLEGGTALEDGMKVRSK